MRFLFSKVNDFLFIFDFVLPIKKPRAQPWTSLYFSSASALI